MDLEILIIHDSENKLFAGASQGAGLCKVNQLFKLVLHIFNRKRTIVFVSPQLTK